MRKAFPRLVPIARGAVTQGIERIALIGGTRHPRKTRLEIRRYEPVQEGGGIELRLVREFRVGWHNG